MYLPPPLEREILTIARELRLSPDELLRRALCLYVGHEIYGPIGPPPTPEERQQQIVDHFLSTHHWQ